MTGDLTVELLAARHGDAILLEWGAAGDRHRLLVDAGPACAYEPSVQARLKAVAKEGPLDLLVLTHVDADHVEGMILLVNDAAVGLDIKEVWFNGRQHLSSELRAVHGEILSALITERGLPWNQRFNGRAVRSDGPDPFPVRQLPGGLRLTVLAPNSRTLRALLDVWTKECKREGLMADSSVAALDALRSRPKLTPAQSYLSRPPAPDVSRLARSRPAPDTSVTNASSIVLLAEYGPHRVLLAGDATPASLQDAVDGLLHDRQPKELPLSMLTVPHHGSARNVTPELIRMLPARHYLFSSDGSYHRHPHDVAVAVVIENAPPEVELVFNYATPHSLRWDDDRVRDRYGYRVRYPTDPGGGVAVDSG